MEKITPFLWFNDNAEEAINFYASIFEDSKILNVVRNGDGGMGPKGSLFSATFLLAGRPYMVLNGGPHFKLNEAFSLFVSCNTQEEVDALWTKLPADGGATSRCGWLKDRFGVSWQIVPTALGELMHGPDPVKSKRVMQAMLKMTKLDIKGLQAAYDGAAENQPG
jgi:predicted 3-demethylubiquinone-9 3-methyltransferase (glyoxalase superfamily)